MLEASLYSLSYVGSSYLNGDFDYTRNGNAHLLISPYSVYKTSDDEWIVIGVATDKQFEVLKEIIGLDDPQREFDTNS